MDSHFRPGKVTDGFSQQVGFEVAWEDGQGQDQRGEGNPGGGHGGIRGMEAGGPAGTREEVRESSRPARPFSSEKRLPPPPEQELPLPWANLSPAPHLQLDHWDRRRHMAAEAPGDTKSGPGTGVCLATRQHTFPSSQAQLLGICLVPVPWVAMARPRPAVHRPAGWTPTQALVHVARLEDRPLR